jgi:hypothetical protein
MRGDSLARKIINFNMSEKPVKIHGNHAGFHIRQKSTTFSQATVLCLGRVMLAESSLGALREG